MFWNYLITGLRNITRHKLYSFINIAGLAVGLACVIFIILFVRDELSYDTWLPDSANLYRVEFTTQEQGRPPLAMAVVPFAMPAAMHDQIPEVTGMTRFTGETMSLTVGDRQFNQSLAAVDPGFFKIIKLPFVTGDPDQALRQPESIVLSQSEARKFFGDADPIGRTIIAGKGLCDQGDIPCFNTTVSLKVTGIVRDLPHNTQLKDDVFLPNTSIADKSPLKVKQSWNSENGYGFVTLAPGTDPDVVVAKMAPILDRNLTPNLKKSGINIIGHEFASIHLTPFTQVHLSSGRWSFNQTPAGSWVTLYGVATVGLLILLLACFNFTNLATARALLRAREIAMRKTLGATRRQLILQFLGESVLTALLALALAMSLVEVLLPLFGGFLQRPITFNYLTDWPFTLLILAIAVAAGLISGLYPALVLSGFRPATVLRASGAGSAGSGRLRAILVVLQFGISIGLGIAAMVVFSQTSFARDIDLGFQHGNIVLINSGGGRMTMSGRQSFIQALRSNDAIIDVAMSQYVPFDTGQSLDSIRVPGRSDPVTVNQNVISPNFPTFYGIRLLAGRLLSDSRAQDSVNARTNVPGDAVNQGHNILINQAAAARLGFTPEQAVGKLILYNKTQLHIAGVLADAKFSGAREPVRPWVYMYDPDLGGEASVRIRADAMPEALKFIDASWHAFAPTVAIRRSFLDDNFATLYIADDRQGRMLGFFVGIAIFIACLGLFGLAAFTAGRRTREIGIRKVFGARTSDLIFLLLWQFSIPVLLANLIAWPFAWYYLHDWLEGFAYRIALSPLYFVAAGAVALIIAWVTVFAHAFRVARANPIQALRYE